METREMYGLTAEEYKQFNQTKGIYALVYEDEVIYVGQSKTIGKRLASHNSLNKVQETMKAIKKENGKCNRTKQLAMYMFIDEHREDMQFIILKETEELNEWEKHYITLFKPKFNYKGVDIPYE